MMNMNEFQDVVLTGLGAITALGDFTLHGEKPSAAKISASSESGTIENFALENYLASQKTYLDRCSALALAGCALALKDAQIEAAADAARFGIILGTHFGCIETMKGFWDKAIEKGVRLANPLLFSHSYFNSPISLCAIEFGLKGYHATFCANENSGAEAVRAAFDAIRLGHADAMVCGGVDAVTPTRALCAPGERAGEASVFFVLENKNMPWIAVPKPLPPSANPGSIASNSPKKCRTFRRLWRCRQHPGACPLHTRLHITLNFSWPFFNIAFTK
nr:3-oxoacyl-[acyl-carrier-protein] synthase KASII [uncultured bacterium]